jgi:hypothetical protein
MCARYVEDGVGGKQYEQGEIGVHKCETHKYKLVWLTVCEPPLSLMMPSKIGCALMC